MTTNPPAVRIITLPVQGYTASGPASGAPTAYWPTAEPDDDLDYGLDITAQLATGDSIATVALSVQPSGAGELEYANLSVAGNVIVWWGGGGVAGRSYTVKIDVVTAQSRSMSFLAGLLIDPALATGPIPPPPSPFFGMPIMVTLPCSLSLEFFENNDEYGTTGMYLVEANGPIGCVVNPSAVFNAGTKAVSESPTLLELVVPNYPITGIAGNILIWPGCHTVLTGGPCTSLLATQSSGEDGTYQSGIITDLNGQNGPWGSYELRNLTVGFRVVAMNSQTGAIYQPGQPLNWRAQNGGDWTGLTVGATVSSDPLNPLTAGAMNFYVAAATFANLAAAQAAMPVGWAPNQAYYFPWSYGLVVQSVTQYIGTLNGSVNPYLVTLVATTDFPGANPTGGLNWTAGYSCTVLLGATSANQITIAAEDAYYVEIGATVTFSGAPAVLTVTKVLDNVIYFSANVTLTTGAIVTFGSGTVITFTSAVPTFYQGSVINLWGSDSTLENVYANGVCHGRQMTMGGKRNKARNVGGWNNVSTAGAGGFFKAGGDWRIDGLYGCSGDEYCASEGSGGGTITVDHFFITSSGPPIAIDQSVSNLQQKAAYPCSTSQTTSVGNVLYMDLATFPLSNPRWSTTNTLTAATAFAAQVAAYAAGNAADLVTAFSKGALGNTPNAVGAVVDTTTGAYYPGLIYCGATVTNVTITGNVVAITLATVAGQANPISVAIPANSGWTVNLGFNYIPWSSNLVGEYTNGSAVCLNDSCMNLLNKDSSGSVTAKLTNVDLNMRNVQHDNTRYGFQIGATSMSGGLNIILKNVTLAGAYALPYETKGNITSLVFEDVTFAAPTLAGTPATQFYGLNNAVLDRVTYCGNAGPVAVLGGVDAADPINGIYRGSNGAVAAVVLRNGTYQTPDGQYAINAQYGRYIVDHGVVQPLDAASTNSANGLFTGSTAINQEIQIIGLDCGAVGTGGVGVNASILNTGYGCSGSTCDETCVSPSAGGTQTIAPLVPYLGTGIHYGGLTTGGTYTMPLGIQQTTYLHLTQAGTTTSGTIVLANSVMPYPQEVKINTNNAFAVTFSSNVNWTAGTTLPNKNGVTFFWDSAASAWVLDTLL